MDSRWRAGNDALRQGARAAISGVRIERQVPLSRRHRERRHALRRHRALVLRAGEAERGAEGAAREDQEGQRLGLGPGFTYTSSIPTLFTLFY